MFRRAQAAIRPQRRIRSILGLGLAVLLALPATAYTVAYFSTTSSGLARALVWRDADVMDYRRLPSRSMDASAAPLELEEAVGTESLSSLVPGDDLATFLKQSETAAFMVIRDDDIAYEGYINGDDGHSTVNSFSVAKSFISTLVGIAIDEGPLAASMIP